MNQINKKKLSLENWATELFLAALLLLNFLFFNVLFSTFLFIFKVSIWKYTSVLSFFMTIVIQLLLLKKYQKLNGKSIIITIIIPISLIIAFIFVSGKIIDDTFDGNSYQKATVGLLANGWNPLYGYIEDFENDFHIHDESPLYMNHYAKGANIYAANIYKLTGNIETGKSQNTISLIAVFLFTMSLLMYQHQNIFFTLLFSLCVVTYPVAVAQVFNNYIDIFTYVYLYLTIYSFFLLEEKKSGIGRMLKLMVLGEVLVLAINVKFSLFGYVGLYCLGYYIWYICRFIKKKIDKKFFVEISLTAMIAVLIGVFVVGLSVYPKNYWEKGHPFYPLMGKEKIDIMTMNQPDYFKEKSPLEKFMIATFSKVANIIEISHEEAEWKIPFSIHQEELWHLRAADTRISGNGVWFGGILIISFMIIVLQLKSVKEILCFIPIGITLVMILLFSEAWYARYFPQVYFLVLFAVLFLNKNRQKWMKVMKYILMIMILINNSITGIQVLKNVYEKNKEYRKEFAIFDAQNLEKGGDLYIDTLSYHGAKFNILDRYGEQYHMIFGTSMPNLENTDNHFFGGKVIWRYEK